MKVELIRYTKDPLDAIAEAASRCYDSIPRASVVKHCIHSGHHSVLEFADFHFKISGVSRALTHQLVRHRLASYAQRSQRYVEEDEFSYTIPESILLDEYCCTRYKDLMEDIQYLYKLLTSKGIPPEDARFILPNACNTVIDAKMNYRELINFSKERLCAKAQWEIRYLAGEMKRLVSEVDPTLGEYLKPKCDWLLHCPEGARGCGRYN